MEVRSRIFEKYTNYKFSIPLRGDEKVFAKKGSYIKYGDKLFESINSSVEKSIYIPKAIGCRVEDSYKYVTRIDGEYIDKGDRIAQKVSKSGLSITEAIAPDSGVLDLSRIDKGYIDILGEAGESIFKSDFDGYINEVNPSDGMVITSNAVCIDAVASTKEDKRYFGKLEILADGSSIITEKMLKDDYRNQIVWVGPYLYDKLAAELFERGAVALITYAISYSEFRSIGLPIAVLGGFGSVHCDMQFVKRLVSFKDKLTILDGIQNQIFIISDIQKENNGWMVDHLVGQTVISRTPGSYGYIGKIVNIENEYALVDIDKKGKILIHLGSLDFIDL